MPTTIVAVVARMKKTKWVDWVLLPRCWGQRVDQSHTIHAHARTQEWLRTTRDMWEHWLFWISGCRLPRKHDLRSTGASCSRWLSHAAAFRTDASRLSPAVSLRLASDRRRQSSEERPSPPRSIAHANGSARQKMTSAPVAQSPAVSPSTVMELRQWECSPAPLQRARRLRRKHGREVGEHQLLLKTEVDSICVHQCCISTQSEICRQFCSRWFLFRHRAFSSPALTLWF